jgi:hypothetical protein
MQVMFLTNQQVRVLALSTMALLVLVWDGLKSEVYVELYGLLVMCCL